MRGLNKPVAGNALITNIEGELATVNRRPGNVESVTNYSVDDDHDRLSSGAVIHLKNLSQVNNPRKALGPVNNATSSASTLAFVASH